MKKYCFILWILICTSLLLSKSTEFTLNFEYENFTQKYYSIERQENYESGMWKSYKIFQNEYINKYQMFFVKASILAPLNKYLYTGFEIGTGIPIKSSINRLEVPALTSNLDGIITIPIDNFIEENYEQRFINEVTVYLIPILYKLELKIPLWEKTNFRLGLGIGSKLIIENIKDSIIYSYIEDFYLFKKGDENNQIKNKTSMYFVPYGEGLISLNFLISSRVSIGLNAKIGYLFPSDFTNEDTDYQQTEWWPAEEKLIKMKSGYIFEGINIIFGIGLKILL